VQINSLHKANAIFGKDMFETTFRDLDDTLRKAVGCRSKLGYIEQTSWVPFLKYLDDLKEFVDNQLLPYLKSSGSHSRSC
jgi:hypothetical protein